MLPETTSESAVEKPAPKEIAPVDFSTTETSRSSAAGSSVRVGSKFTSSKKPSPLSRACEIWSLRAE